MNVLEKILEEIKKPENYTIMCGKHVTTVDRVEEIIRSHMNEKEKVTSAEIVSREVDGKTYYAIKYKEVGKDYYTVGYGSYKLDYVVCWLNEYFEFCGEAKVVVGTGKDTNVPNNDGWIPVEERLPEETTGKYYPEMIVTTSYGAVTWGFYRVMDKQWYIYSNIHNEFVKAGDKEIVAWQPLPKPYKPKKLQTEEKPVQ